MASNNNYQQSRGGKQGQNRSTGNRGQYQRGQRQQGQNYQSQGQLNFGQQYFQGQYQGHTDFLGEQTFQNPNLSNFQNNSQGPDHRDRRNQSGFLPTPLTQQQLCKLSFFLTGF